MSFLAHIKEALDSGDPMVRKWFLVESYYLPFVLCSLYVFFVKRLGPDLMKDRKPFDLRPLMIIYNFSIVSVYVYCLCGLIHVMRTTDALKYICLPFDLKNDPEDFTYKAATLCWIISIIKYAEFADTVFFVLRKKNNLITNLHVIHHAALPILGWIFLRTETNGFQVIPGVINSFVHVIMYTYYGLAAIGPAVQKYLWWKRHLTKLQIVQFIVILLYVFVMVPLTGCKTSTHGIFLDIIFALLFLSLFTNFYVKTYLTSNNTPSPQKAKRKNSDSSVDKKMLLDEYTKINF